MILPILQALTAVANLVANLMKPKPKAPLNHADVSKDVKTVKEWASSTSKVDWEIVKKGKK